MLETTMAVVIEVVMFNPTLRAIRMVPEDGKIPFYYPGDFLYIRAPSANEQSSSAIVSLDGKPQIRAYSLSSAPGDPYLEITVVEKETGAHVSKLLQQINRPGQRLEISAPRWIKTGKLSLTGSSWQQQNLLLIGAGTGIAPFVSMARHVARERISVDVCMVGSFRDHTQLIFHEELSKLASIFPNIGYFPALTRNTPVSWPHHKGRLMEVDEAGNICRNHLPNIVTNIASRHAYVCGSSAMVTHVLRALAASGICKTRIRWESWG